MKDKMLSKEKNGVMGYKSLWLKGLLVLVLFASCRSSAHFLKKGDYARAMEKSIRALEKNPDNLREVDVLLRSAQSLYEETEIRKARLNYDQIAQLKHGVRFNRQMLERFHDAKDFHSDIQAMFQTVKKEQDVFYSLLLNKIYQRASHYYQLAEQSGNKLQYLRAFDLFQEARHYGYKDSLSYYMTAALDKGHMIVLVEAEAPWDLFEQSDIDRSFRRIENKSDSRMSYYYKRLPRETVPDFHIAVDFSSLDRDVSTWCTTESYTESVKTGESVTYDTSGIEIRTPIYTDVYATVSTTKETLSYRWLAHYAISSPFDYVPTRRYSRWYSYESEVENVSYTGDSRALPSSYSCISAESHPSDCYMLDEVLSDHYFHLQSIDLLE